MDKNIPWSIVTLNTACNLQAVTVILKPDPLCLVYLPVWNHCNSFNYTQSPFNTHTHTDTMWYLTKFANTTLLTVNKI